MNEVQVTIYSGSELDIEQTRQNCKDRRDCCYSSPSQVNKLIEQPLHQFLKAPQQVTALVITTAVFSEGILKT